MVDLFQEVDTCKYRLSKLELKATDKPFAFVVYQMQDLTAANKEWQTAMFDSRDPDFEKYMEFLATKMPIDQLMSWAQKNIGERSHGQYLAIDGISCNMDISSGLGVRNHTATITHNLPDNKQAIEFDGHFINIYRLVPRELNIPSGPLLEYYYERLCTITDNSVEWDNKYYMGQSFTRVHDMLKNGDMDSFRAWVKNAVVTERVQESSITPSSAPQSSYSAIIPERQLDMKIDLIAYMCENPQIDLSGQIGKLTKIHDQMKMAIGQSLAP